MHLRSTATIPAAVWDFGFLNFFLATIGNVKKHTYMYTTQKKLEVKIFVHINIS